MNILIIGGSGFIGRHLGSQLFESGHTVTVFHRGNAPVRPGTGQILGDHNSLSEHRNTFLREKFDVVIDMLLSSESQARKLMDTFRGLTGRVVALSSMDVYRAWGVFYCLETGGLQELPVTEDSELRTKQIRYPPEVLKKVQEIFSWMNDEYEKITVEKEVLNNDGELPGTVVRLPMVYGPGDPLHRLHFLLKRMDDGRRSIIFADDVAAVRTPRGYVENVAHAIALAATLERASGRVYNVCEPTAFSELDWARRAAAVAGWEGDFVVLPHDKTPKHLLWPGNTAQHLVVSSDRIRAELAYREQVPLNEALRRTIQWEREHLPQNPMAQFDYPAEDDALQRLEAAS
ncbi:MAG TPA: NAD-dependent epimerase/dehydratase family protein [Candidatus Angelobacter sp.]|nr:NAD-dependent epimerase/dehydratase family protein [Candidatus Angelobacter sp.]